MVSKPVDPIVRVSLVTAWVKQQRRLVVAVLAMLMVTAWAWASLIGPSSTVWSGSELENLSNLPLAPEEAPIVPGDPDAVDREAFLQLQRDMARQPRPDL